ncbi:hypothetical protein [Phytohabitans kaempferiae]|uniref:DUF2357 domain-containing protein n=1 Tax=Phytohabitans kaempferiae TaxID=1620943 RepID=A0ABV6LUN1_9ACTN
MPNGFWDRITGELVGRLPARPLLGRYALAVPGSVNGRDAPAYSPIVPTASARWSATASGSARTGSFPRGALPGPKLASHVAAVCAALADAVARAPSPDAPHERPYERWAAVPPLATDVLAQLRGARDDDPVAVLEREIDAHLGHLEAVCQRPEARLRREAVVLPLSRTRRMAPDAIDFLAEHTEDWQKRTIGGVFPKRLRAVHNEPDTDLYENRAALQLVDHLVEFLEWRQAKLEGASDSLKGLEDLGRQLQGRPWRAGHRLSTLLGELVDYNALSADVADRLAQNRERRRRVERLHASRLYRDRRVRRQVELPAELRPTNLLTFHEDYRRVGQIWRAWARVNREAGLGDAVSPRRLCDNYGEFVTLLVARSLETLGYRAVTPHVPVPGGPDVHYAGLDDDTLTLRCGPDGTLTVRRDADPLVVFVPLPHPLTADPEATDLRTLVDELDRHRRPGGPLRVVVYPGTRAERADLRSMSPWRADSVGNDLPGRPGVGLLSAVPTEIDSVERVTRALQWARFAPDAAAYPPPVRCSTDLHGDVVPTCSPWLAAAAGSGHLVLRRPPSAAESQRLDELVERWRAERLPSARRRERDAAVQTFTGALRAALATVRRLARCPVCTREANPGTDFQSQARTFWIACRRCSSEWGNRSCTSCGAHFPIVHMRPASSGASSTASGLGNEVLATPCRQAGAGAGYICPACGHCGAGAQTARECHRCIALQSTTPRR